MGDLNGSAGNHANGTAFALKEEPVENLRPLKVRVVGAGYSGICAAIRSAMLSPPRSHGYTSDAGSRIPERLRNIDLVVYEKNEGIGGVW